MRAEGVDDLAHQQLGRGSPCRDADGGEALQRRPVELGRPLHQHGARGAAALAHFDETARVRGIGRTHHKEKLDPGRDGLHRLLAVGGGIADVFLEGPLDGGEALLQGCDHVPGVVDRQRGLGDIGELRGVLHLKPAHILRRLDENHRARRKLPHGADHLRVAAVSDQDDLKALGMVALCLHVHFGHQRAGRIELEHVARGGRRRHGFRHAMGREHHRTVAVRNLVQLVDEYGALGLEVVDHELVVHDLVAHIDRCPVEGERPLHDVDRPHHAGTEAARRRDKDLERRLRHAQQMRGEAGDVNIRHVRRGMPLEDPPHITGEQLELDPLPGAQFPHQEAHGQPQGLTAIIAATGPVLHLDAGVDHRHAPHGVGGAAEQPGNAPAEAVARIIGRGHAFHLRPPQAEDNSIGVCNRHQPILARTPDGGILQAEMGVVDAGRPDPDLGPRLHHGEAPPDQPRPIGAAGVGMDDQQALAAAGAEAGRELRPPVGRVVEARHIAFGGEVKCGVRVGIDHMRVEATRAGGPRDAGRCVMHALPRDDEDLYFHGTPQLQMDRNEFNCRAENSRIAAQ